MFSKGDQWSWLKIEVARGKKLTEYYQGLLVAYRKNALPYRMVSLVVAYDWLRVILTHGAWCTCRTNYHLRLLLLISTTPFMSGYVVQTSTYIAKQSPHYAAWRFLSCRKQYYSYCNNDSVKSWNFLPTHLTWILVTLICFQNWRNPSKATNFKLFHLYSMQ